MAAATTFEAVRQVDGDKRRSRWFLVLLALCALLYAFNTVATFVRTVRPEYIEGTQADRHQAMIDFTSKDPNQYRILADYMLEPVLGLLSRMHVPRPTLVGFTGFRFAQDWLLFVLAGLYFKKLGLSTERIFIGLTIVMWSMTYAFFNADLCFNSSFDVIFYLLGALAVLNGRYLWLLPISFFAALNRETSGLVPFLALAAAPWQLSERKRRQVFAVMAVSVLLYFLVIFAVRWSIGPRPHWVVHGIYHPSLAYIWYQNLRRPVTWAQLSVTFGIVPLIALVCIRSWPRALQILFWVIVPLWAVVHIAVANWSESRVFLVPFVLVFVPGAMFAMAQDTIRTKTE